MSLQTAKKRFLKRDLIQIEDFNSLKESDPSKTYKYLEKLCEYFIFDRASLEDLKHEIKAFHEIPDSYLLNNDIQSVPNYLKFKEIVQDSLNKHNEILKFRKLEDRIQTVLDNEDYLIVVPDSKEASIKYGKGTTWCTSAITNNAFKRSSRF